MTKRKGAVATNTLPHIFFMSWAGMLMRKDLKHKTYEPEMLHMQKLALTSHMSAAKRNTQASN